MLPKQVDEWNLKVIEDLVSNSVFESDEFDFKEKLPRAADEKGINRLRKTVAAFANSGGGYLIFGVRDGKELAQSSRLVGIQATDDLPEQFGAHAANCEPSVEWKFKNPPIKLADGRLIHVVQIFSAWKGPHAIQVKDGNFIFPKRTNKGNEEMAYSEIKSAFHEIEFKRIKLSLLISELEFIKKSANRLTESIPDPSILVEGTYHWAWATRYNTALLDQTLGDTFYFFSDTPELWSFLCQVRDAAKHSNVACEALSKIVYLSMSNKPEINQEHYKLVKKCAHNIISFSEKAVPLLRAVAR